VSGEQGGPEPPAGAGPGPGIAAELTGAEHRADREAIGCFVVATVAAAGLAVVLWRGGASPQVEGVLLAVALLATGAGIVVTAHRLLPGEEAAEERPVRFDEPGDQDGDQDKVSADLRAWGALGRRRLLARSFGLAVAGAGAASLALLRALGPSEDGALSRTPWAGGARLVTDDGRPVRADEVPESGLLTVFPEGHPGSADGQAVLLRLQPGELGPDRARSSPGNLVAFSKVCTHAGCPVGLYQVESQTLLCPCHQSAFDVLHGAKPVFGPAARPLPELPLAIDGDGYVRATGDFSAPVGPAYWARP